MYWRCSSYSTFAVSTLTPKEKRKTRTRRKKRTRTRRPCWHGSTSGSVGWAHLRGSGKDNMDLGLFRTLSGHCWVKWHEDRVPAWGSGCAPWTSFFLDGLSQGRFSVPWAYWALLALLLQVAVLRIALIAMGRLVQDGTTNLWPPGNYHTRRLKCIGFDARIPPEFPWWVFSVGKWSFYCTLATRVKAPSTHLSVLVTELVLSAFCGLLLFYHQLRYGSLPSEGSCAFSTGLDLYFKSTDSTSWIPKQILSWCWPRSVHYNSIFAMGMVGSGKYWSERNLRHLGEGLKPFFQASVTLNISRYQYYPSGCDAYQLAQYHAKDPNNTSSWCAWPRVK